MTASTRPLAFSPDDAGDLLGLGRTTVYAEIASGRLRSFKVGKKRLVPAFALDEYIADRMAEQEAGAA